MLRCVAARFERRGIVSLSVSKSLCGVTSESDEDAESELLLEVELVDLAELLLLNLELRFLQLDDVLDDDDRFS